LWRTAYLLESGAITSHRRVVLQSGPHFTKDVGRTGIRWLNQSIVNPLAFATRGNHPRTTQVSKVPRDLRLINLQHLNEETNANFVVSHEINQPQASVIRECFKQKCDAIFFVAHGVSIYLFGWLNYYDFWCFRVPFLPNNLRPKRADFYPDLALKLLIAD
jgi:hypothetical protein